MSLLSWVWRSYVRNALVPLLLVELLLVTAYLASHSWSLNRHVEALRELARQELSLIASDESAVIEQQLGQVAGLIDTLRRQAAVALATPGARPADRSRLRVTPSGVLASVVDDGGAAVFHSAGVPRGPEVYERIERLAAIDGLLRDITEVNPLVVQTYVNTRESIVRLWPGIGMAATLDPHLDVSKFNFYYEADAAHNPERSVVWTDAFVDPAGQGWIVSAIAPIYRGDVLEAVAGADVTIDRIGADVLNKEIPWQGFVLLIGKSGTLLALPPAGERLFDLKELTTHDYVDAIREDTLKPEAFNVFERADFAAIGKLLRNQASGSATLNGPEPYLVAWETIPSSGWKLMSLVPEAAVFGPSRKLADDLVAIGWIMLGGLVGFYLFFFSFLYHRARAVSRSISEPLAEIERMAHRIAIGDYEHELPDFEVSEFRHTAGELERMGRLLGDSNRARETAETRLTERNEELSTILSLSPDGLVSFDARGIVTETNPAFLDMTGWARDELIGRSGAEFWSRLAAQGAGSEPETGDQAILRLQHPQPLALECRVVVAAGGAKVAYFRDVTRADELDRTKSRFLATAAHELRTPIAVITGYTEFLEDSNPPARQRREILATMRRHGDQITGILTELLDLARIEARAGRDFTLVRQPLAPAVRDFVGTFRIGEDARVPRLAGDIGDTEAVIDADKFTQALGNVLSNACKYSPPGSPVTVELVATGDEVGVQVRDEGEGMDEEVMRRIFERFYRGESAAGVPGSGLGMSIVKEIMDIHGGRVDIKSCPGRGTTVTLWLPRAATRG